MGPRPVAIRRGASQQRREYANRVAYSPGDEGRGGAQPAQAPTARHRVCAGLPPQGRRRSGDRDPSCPPSRVDRFAITGAPKPMQARWNYWLIRLVISLLGLYRNTLSLILLDSCRFTPTCSAYAQEAFQKHGLLSGTRLTIRRMLRCHPFSDFGLDPVP
jgi:uncharacterized protein